MEAQLDLNPGHTRFISGKLRNDMASMPEGKMTKPLNSHPRWRVGQLTPALRLKSKVLGR